MKKLLLGLGAALSLICLVGHAAQVNKKPIVLIKKLLIVQPDAVPDSSMRAACVMIKPASLFSAKDDAGDIDAVDKRQLWFHLEKKSTHAKVNLNDLVIVCASWTKKAKFDKRQAPHYIQDHLKFKKAKRGKWKSVPAEALETFS
ncbi:MAG: hypothetical protein KAS93_02960 [Gammaproteobacteria bacterium]|nr:hypothetical protein [Gammaproteobacteria bacterium]